jgi:hypothetical protein
MTEEDPRESPPGQTPLTDMRPAETPPATEAETPPGTEDEEGLSGPSRALPFSARSGPPAPPDTGQSRRHGTGVLGTPGSDEVPAPPAPSGPVFDQETAPTPPGGSPLELTAAGPLRPLSTLDPAAGQAGQGSIATAPARIAPRPGTPRLGELAGRALDGRAIDVNTHRIGKLEPEWDTWHRIRSLILLAVVVVIVAAAVAAAFSIVVEIIGAAANHAISKSAGS